MVMDNKIKIGIGVVVVVIVAILVLGYLGFVPLLSDLMGVNNPVNLGVKYTQSDLDSARSKLGLTIDNSSSSNSTSIKILKTAPVKTQLNSAEVTALINYIADNWKNSPIKNIQVLINSDGSVEVSGTIIPNRFDGFAAAVNMSNSTLNDIKPLVSMVQTNPSFYTKFSFSITNGTVSSSFNTIQIGKVTVPADDMAKVQPAFNNFVTNIAKPPMNLLGNVSFENGEMIVDGTIPTQIYIAPP